MELHDQTTPPNAVVAVIVESLLSEGCAPLALALQAIALVVRIDGIEEEDLVNQFVQSVYAFAMAPLPSSGF